MLQRIASPVKVPNDHLHRSYRPYAVKPTVPTATLGPPAATQPPSPHKLFCYASSNPTLKASFSLNPRSPDLRGRRIRMACGHCRRPLLGVVTVPSCQTSYAFRLSLLPLTCSSLAFSMPLPKRRMKIMPNSCPKM